MQTMTPGEAWEWFVGFQTPAEFMEVSRRKYTQHMSIDDAITVHVEHIFCTSDNAHTIDDFCTIADLLTTYIRESGVK